MQQQTTNEQRQLYTETLCPRIKNPSDQKEKHRVMSIPRGAADGASALTFRGRPVFEARSCTFDQELVVLLQDDEAASLEEVRAQVYRFYEEILQLRPSLDTAHRVYVHWNDKNRRSEDTSDQFGRSNCDPFLDFFYTHHKELTDYRSWSGSDIRQLLYILEVIRVHLHALFRALDTASVALRDRFERDVVLGVYDVD